MIYTRHSQQSAPYGCQVQVVIPRTMQHCRVWHSWNESLPIIVYLRWMLIPRSLCNFFWSCVLYSFWYPLSMGTFVLSVNNFFNILIRYKFTISKWIRYQIITHLLFISVKRLVKKLWSFTASTLYSLYSFCTFSLGHSSYTNTS